MANKLTKSIVINELINYLKDEQLLQGFLDHMEDKEFDVEEVEAKLDEIVESFN